MFSSGVYLVPQYPSPFFLLKIDINGIEFVEFRYSTKKLILQFESWNNFIIDNPLIGYKKNFIV